MSPVDDRFSLGEMAAPVQRCVDFADNAAWKLTEAGGVAVWLLR